jgi:hypothetical protein
VAQSPPKGPTSRWRRRPTRTRRGTRCTPSPPSSRRCGSTKRPGRYACPGTNADVRSAGPDYAENPARAAVSKGAPATACQGAGSWHGARGTVCGGTARDRRQNTTTGHYACWVTWRLMDFRSAAEKPPRPRSPTTSSPALWRAGRTPGMVDQPQAVNACPLSQDPGATGARQRFSLLYLFTMLSALSCGSQPLESVGLPTHRLDNCPRTAWTTAHAPPGPPVPLATAGRPRRPPSP